MAQVNLQQLLFTMQDMKVEIHIYKNHSHAITLVDEDGNTTYQGGEEVEVVKGTTNQVTLHFIMKRGKVDWNKLETFYIGYLKKRSRTLRINAEIVEA
jgi:hypothetical protein